MSKFFVLASTALAFGGIVADGASFRPRRELETCNMDLTALNDDTGKFSMGKAFGMLGDVDAFYAANKASMSKLVYLIARDSYCQGQLLTNGIVQGILNGNDISIELLKDQDNKKPGVAFCKCMVNAVPLADFCSEQKPGVDDCKMGGDTAPSVRTILSTCIVHQNATREAGKFKIKEADVAMTCKQNLATTTVAATTAAATTAAATTASATVPETEATTAAPVKTNTLSTIDQLKKEVTIAKALVLEQSKKLTIAKEQKESADSKYKKTCAGKPEDDKCKEMKEQLKVATAEMTKVQSAYTKAQTAESAKQSASDAAVGITTATTPPPGSAATSLSAALASSITGLALAMCM